MSMEEKLVKLRSEMMQLGYAAYIIRKNFIIVFNYIVSRNFLIQLPKMNMGVNM
jgi:hypothetical protein